MKDHWYELAGRISGALEAHEQGVATAEQVIKMAKVCLGDFALAEYGVADYNLSRAIEARDKKGVAT